MKIKTILSTFAMLCCSYLVFGQTGGKVTVVKDPLIDSLIARRIALTKGVSGNGSALIVNGYRVQIFFGSDRREAYAQQAKYKDLYPESDTYLSYDTPNYRVKVGDFRTRAQAQSFLNELKQSFQTLFIFSEKINPLKADKFNADR